MCEHCQKVNDVLTELTGPKVAGVIMRRVEAKIHPLAAKEVSPTLLVVSV